MFTGKINEFTNWTTGIDERTLKVILGVSLDNKISGESIRNLITEHLKRPFVTVTDEIKGVIRIFSSTEIADEWWKYANPDETNLNYNPEKAGEIVNTYQIWEIELPATYKITGLDSFLSARYIIEGNSSSPNAELRYTLGIEDSLGEASSDVVSVIYTIKDSSGNVTYNEPNQVETGKVTVKNIYLYLRSGDNEITIKATANNHNASTTKTFHIYLVTFSISSNFTGYYTGISNGRPFAFDVAIKRSITNLPVTVNVYISDNSSMNLTPVATWRYTESGSAPSNRFEIPNTYLASDYENDRKYRMVIKALMNDSESLSTFDSNVLIYEFEIASNEGDVVNQFINCAYSVSDSNYNYIPSGKPILYATQYIPFIFEWGYYTDAGSQLSDVDWYLRTGQSGSYTYYDLVSILGVKGAKPNSLTFIPNNHFTFGDDNSYLVAKINDVIVEEYPITIAENNVNVSETGNYSLKLSAYGKTNESETKDVWIDYDNNINTTFSSGVLFDNSNGWDKNSLVLKGIESYATINYCPFPEILDGNSYNVSSNGATFEIDFKPELVNNDNDIILTIGDTSKGYIAITPTSAAFYENSITPTIKTNFKAGERIKLCFIFNRYSEISNDSNLIYIVNNGILERAAVKGNAAINSSSGRIKIGGSRSGIRVYSIRAYRHDISPKLELDNYMFDNISNSALISRNDIYGDSSSITYTGMQGKQDIIVIEGDLSNILNNALAKENATVKISRESNSDSSKDFTVTGCRIRNHGQSTLSYPITSMKIWFNKSNSFYEDAQGIVLERIPELVCSSLLYLNLNKNRYIMKNGSIPSNKFVLQANYADSSGAHNGSLLRLINDTWYNAQIGGEYKLRTAPLLFSSGAKINHNNPELNENGSWIEGLYNISSSESYYDINKIGKTWPELTGELFPYQIRNAADSFPCTVFYRDTSSQDLNLTLLGQYVFMDDKKSDFIYGERSIYYTDDLTDPFCLKIENKKKDSKENKVWDNGKVLQIEVVYPNSPLTSYSSKTIASSYTLDENDNLIPSGEQHRFDDVYTTDQQGNTESYYWEQHFELIYPDKEDIVDKNDNFSSSKFVETVTPFMNFLEWITDVAALRNSGAKLGLTGSLARVTLAELTKFINEAHDHLDLYKLAAYYIFFLRFGLIDSVERNAQLKTYDGQHWHYEPWDMDIALGCANNGVIAYEPPLTRDTLAGGSTYAFSGRTATLSNVLWDCLECWDYWANTLVPEVAEALYEAGLTYDNISDMFDKEYVEKWSETLYNESGHYKYIDATLNPKYRLYLNGARTSHRHWWLSKSMNYYDAKWSCGDFTKHSILFRISKSGAPSGMHLIKIYPTNNTFFKMLYGAKGSETGITPIGNLTEATTINGGEAVIDVNLTLDKKLPTFIFGASSIEGLDLSNLLTSTNNAKLAEGYTDIDFKDSYDSVLGACIKWLKLGAPCTPNLYTNPNENTYISNLSVGGNGIDGMTLEGNDALENLELLDVVGWYNKIDTQGVSGWLSNLFSGQGYDRKNITTLYAMGCDMATEFKTSNAGNKFVDLRLPATVTTLEFTNSSWENISFWTSTSLGDTRALYDKIQGIPASINSVSFKGTTAKNQCSIDLILSWIDNIEAEIATAHPGYTEDLLESALWEALSSKVIYAEQINWGTGTTKLYYKDIIRLSKFGNNGILYNLKGYVVISDATALTSVLLAELLNIFGDYVFNIGTTNTNLVVDQNIGFVRISVIGEIVDNLSSISIQNGEIYINEPNRANLSATTFSLRNNLATNTIVNTELLYSLFENNHLENVYLWGLSETSGNVGELTNLLKSVKLEKRNNGSVRIAVSEGDFGDYYFFVNVYYVDGLTIKHDSVKINVVGVTYPTDYEFIFTKSSPRLFLYTLPIAANIFGLEYSLQVPLPPVYILYDLNLKVEISINPVGTYTATLNNIQYYLLSLQDTSNNTGFIDRELLSLNDTVLNVLGLDSSIGYTKDSVNEGMTIQINGTPPSNILKYRLVARIFIGGKNAIDKPLTFITWNDHNVIIPYNTSDGRYKAVETLYNSNYSLNNWGRSVYKSDLLSLYGTLDFSLFAGITTSLLTTNGDSMFLYTKYISGINLNGCTSIPLTDLSTSAKHIVLSDDNNPNLTTLSLNGCTGLIGELDLSNAKNITSIDTRNSNVGLKLIGSRVTSLLLGSPISLDINSPFSLGDVGTTFTIQSKDNLTTLQLLEINTTNCHTFGMFNTILNAVSS